MSRQYADRIAVQCRAPQLLPATGDTAGAPQRFTWRRRRYRVLAVLQRWIEVGSWWRTAASTDQEYEMWRVEAASERSPAGRTGQYDLCRHRGSDHWFLVRTFD